MFRYDISIGCGVKGMPWGTWLVLQTPLIKDILQVLNLQAIIIFCFRFFGSGLVTKML
ncbi:MAG: hypothetical protein ABI683_14755 [Ginsengibacter sp.]